MYVRVSVYARVVNAFVSMGGARATHTHTHARTHARTHTHTHTHTHTDTHTCVLLIVISTDVIHTRSNSVVLVIHLFIHRQMAYHGVHQPSDWTEKPKDARRLC